MTLTSMDYFVAVARERSFTRAAEQLHITQQSLSAHIAALEQELGCPLLVRRVPLELTYAGTVFLRYAAGFQKNVNALRQEFCDITNNQKGVLRIGIAHTRGRAIMPALIGAFRRVYPNIAVELVEDSNEALLRHLGNGEIDLAIAKFPGAVQGVELRDFYREEMVLLASRAMLAELYGSRAEAVTAAAVGGDLSVLGDCPFVMGRTTDVAARIALAVFRDAGISPEIRVRSDNIETLLTLCVQGVGACFCPDNLALATLTPEELAGLAVIRLGERARYPIRFGFSRQSYQWSVLSAFIRIAREAWPEPRGFESGE